MNLQVLHLINSISHRLFAIHLFMLFNTLILETQNSQYLSSHVSCGDLEDTILCSVECSVWHYKESVGRQAESPQMRGFFIFESLNQMWKWSVSSWPSMVLKSCLHQTVKSHWSSNFAIWTQRKGQVEDLKMAIFHSWRKDFSGFQDQFLEPPSDSRQEQAQAATGPSTEETGEEIQVHGNSPRH